MRCHFLYCLNPEARLFPRYAGIEKGVKKEAIWDSQAIHSTQGVSNCRNKGVQVMDCRWNWCISQKTSSKKLAKQMSFEWRATSARNNQWETVWTSSWWYWSFWNSASLLSNFPLTFRKTTVSKRMEFWWKRTETWKVL